MSKDELQELLLQYGQIGLSEDSQVPEPISSFFNISHETLILWRKIVSDSSESYLPLFLASKSTRQ